LLFRFSYRFIRVVSDFLIEPLDAGGDRDPREAHVQSINQDGGFPHSNEPVESKRVELWVGVTPSELSPVIWIPMKRDPEGDEAKGRGLEQKYQAQ